MRTWSAVSFGVFLVTLGIGWYIFSGMEVSAGTFVWILLIAGAALIIISLASWKRPGWPARGLFAAIVGGLLISLLITGGFTIITGLTGGSFWFYTANGTKSYSGIVSTNNLHIQIDNFNGPIRVSTWDVPRYNINLTIRAGGSSQAVADDKLASLNVIFNDTTTAGVERIFLNYSVPSSDYSSYAIEVDAFLPSNVKLNLDLHSSNGGIYLTNTNGTSVNMQTSNGPLALGKVYVGTLTGHTSNGLVEGNIEAENAVITTSNGKIELTVPSTTTRSYDFTTTNGEIDLQVSNSSQVGYSIAASTSNANINLNLANLNYSVDQKTTKQARTVGFDTKKIQVTILTTTSNGNVNVNPS